MSEMDAFNQAYDELPPEEKQRVAIQMYLNKAQQNLIAPPMQQEYQRTPYQRPENLGQGLKNIGSNLVGNLLRGVGASPSYREVTANIAQEEHRRDVSQSQIDFARDLIGRNHLKNLSPDNADLIDALSNEQVGNVMTNLHGKVEYDDYGNAFQVNTLTGQRTSVNQLPAPLQQYHYANSQNQKRLNQDQQNLAAPMTQAQYETGNQLRLKSGELANTDLSALGQTYRENATLGNATAIKMDQLSDLLTIYNSQTGTGQELLNRAKGLGYNLLGIEGFDTSKEDIFNAITTGIIIPEIKQLGNNPTDFDFQQVQKVFPSLQQTPQGNMILIQLKKIEAARSKLINEKWIEFNNANFDIRQTNPARFQFDWNQKLSQIQNSAEFRGEEVTQLTRRAFESLDMTPPAERSGGVVQDVRAGGTNR